jgi:putative ABC transport system permease protein
MFLALRELRFARMRFALMGAVVALIAVLMVLLSGLSVGLVNDGVSGLKKLPVSSFAFEHGVQTDAAFSRSVVSLDAVDTWRTRPGVTEAAPFGNTLVNTRSDRGTEIDLALFGVEPGSFLAPRPADGSGLGDVANGIVVSRTAIEEGLRIGDTVTVDRLGTKLVVVGSLAGQHTFGHVDVAYVALPVWQRIKAGAAPGDPVPDHALHEATAVAVRAEPGRTVDLSAGDRAAGTESLSLHDAFGASPGYTAETSTLTLIQAFLYAIAALVVGAFFTVWTIQRKQEIAVMRAMGASTRYLLGDGLAQALVLLVVSIAAGVAVGLGVGGLVGGGVPFALTGTAVGIAAGLLLALGLAGAAAAVARIAAVDPVSALGANR